MIDALADIPDDGHLGLVHDDLGGGLDAHVEDGLGGRTHEDDVVLLAQLGELCVLREEAVARVDGLERDVKSKLIKLRLYCLVT